jgi:SAM-dependent methyltransferase
MPALFDKISSLDSWLGLVAKAEGHAWERYFCAETRASSIGPQEPHPQDTIRYEPLPWTLVRSGIELLDLQPDDVFVDYGAGLGRALLMAASHRVKQVMGIEFLPELAARAEANMKAAQHRLKSPVKVIVADAAAWEVPDDLTVAYLFNPFVGTVMEAVQEKLRASLERRPRPFRLLYAHAKDQRDLFAPCDWLVRRVSLSGRVFTGTLSVYEAG